MLSNLTGWHFLIILVVILLLFGAPKLPGLARSLGQSLKIFKSEITPVRTDETKPPDANPGDPGAGTPHPTSADTDSSGTPKPKA